jgi:hypothetical protein
MNETEEDAEAKVIRRHQGTEDEVTPVFIF